MHTCLPTEFKNRWPGVLRAIELPTSLPPIPGDCRGMLTEFGLPHALTIYCYNDIHLKFSDLLVPLAEIWSRDVKLGYRVGEMPNEWNRFWHVGDQEYLQGGGWICIEEVSGRLVIIDLDQPDPVYLLNSSVLNFYTTLAYFLDWSEKTDGRPEEIVALRTAFRQMNLWISG